MNVVIWRKSISNVHTSPHEAQVHFILNQGMDGICVTQLTQIGFCHDLAIWRTLLAKQYFFRALKIRYVPPPPQDLVSFHNWTWVAHMEETSIYQDIYLPMWSYNMSLFLLLYVQNRLLSTIICLYSRILDMNPSFSTTTYS